MTLRPWASPRALLALTAAGLFCTAARAQAAAPLPAAAAVATSATAHRFDFGGGAVAPGYTGVTARTGYDPARGYGFLDTTALREVDRGPADALRGDFVTSERPFFFAVALPEGNYRVTVTLGDPAGETVTTIKAEQRRLMVEKVATAKGEVVTRTFLVHVRTPRLKSGERVRLKQREFAFNHWDDKLTLEFGNTRPGLAALEIEPAGDVPVVFIAGDSTVTDQDKEPWAGWGQMLPRFFGPGVVVANYAESGEAARSFIAERRLEKIFDTMKAGDYLLVQFGHNDQKERGEGVGAFTTYKAAVERYVAGARERGAQPVLVTSMVRRRFDQAGRLEETLGDYPAALRQLAHEQNVPLIDLNAMSRVLVEAIGTEASKLAYVHHPAGAFPGQDKALSDDTHFSPYGAYQLARCVVEGLRAALPALAAELVPEAGRFDPAKPDARADWSLPATPLTEPLAVPEGR